MYELSIQLIFIILVKQFSMNFLEIILPWLKVKWNTFRHSKKTDGEKVKLERWEEDYDLEPVDSLTLFNEYLELTIQFGFISLFVTAFPLAPLLALINNIIEIRLDAKKFLKYRQRMIAAPAWSIGPWEDFMVLIANLSIVTNAFVIAITSTTIPKYVYSMQQMGGSYNMTGFVEY